MSEMISVKIEGLDRLNAAFKKAPGVVSAELKRAIQSAITILQGSARMLAPKDLSHLAGAIKTEMTSALSGQVYADTNYALFVHEGTKPHWPPIDAITPWANRHGIPPFLVARSIAQKGTKPQPFFQWAKDATENDVFGLFEAAISNIVNKIFS